jgi:predicted DNA-binding transcriptional regulator AlpA
MSRTTSQLKNPTTSYVEPPRNDDPLIGTAEVAARLMCHPVSVFRFMRENPDFPVPQRISANRLAWRESAITNYIASRPLRTHKTAASK